MKVVDGGEVGEGERALRLARAKKLLGTAERSVGLRTRLTVLPGGAEAEQNPAHPAGPAGPTYPTGSPGVTAAGARALGDVLAVPDALTPLLPGGLPRGSVVQVEGSTSLLLAMAGAACAGGAWCAMTSVPHVGWQAAAAAGLPLDRIAVVPAPGPDAPLVLAALADGFDVLVVGDARGMTARDQRSLSARLRTRGAVLLTSAPWPEAHVTLTGHALGLAGLGAGDGYLRGVDWRVTVSGRLALRQGTEGGAVDVRLGAGGLQPVAAAARAGYGEARTGTDAQTGGGHAGGDGARAPIDRDDLLAHLDARRGTARAV